VGWLRRLGFTAAAQRNWATRRQAWRALFWSPRVLLRVSIVRPACWSSAYPAMAECAKKIWGLQNWRNGSGADGAVFGGAAELPSRVFAFSNLTSLRRAGVTIFDSEPRC
jgi:hypothetical protein